MDSLRGDDETWVELYTIWEEVQAGAWSVRVSQARRLPLRMSCINLFAFAADEGFGFFAADVVAELDRGRFEEIR